MYFGSGATFEGKASGSGLTAQAQSTEDLNKELPKAQLAPDAHNGLSAAQKVEGLKDYLHARFSLSKADAPHDMVF